MESKEKKQIKQKEAGENYYLNKKCLLAKSLNYSPYRRCQYCELKFHNCLFMRFQLISFILVSLSFLLIYLSEKTLPASFIVVIFTMVIVYGYFFNSSTEKIVKSNFLEKRAKNALKELSDDLEERVDVQTRDIRQKNEHLKELLSIKSDFLRTVNHQLNTPLSIMKNAFAMMKDKSLSTEQGMKIASHGLERMADTMEDFWDAFEMGEQTAPVVLIETDIEKIIKEMVKEKKRMDQTLSKKLKIRLVKPAFPVPKVLCDHKKIKHAISNLLDNAIFYTQEGSVRVCFRKLKEGKKEYLKIFISDTGEGISPEDQKKLFIKFSRGSATSSAYPNGSGLGLYIAKNIIKNSKGELKLEKSKIGIGTTFSFILEIAKSGKSSKTGGAKIIKAVAKKDKPARNSKVHK